MHKRAAFLTLAPAALALMAGTAAHGREDAQSPAAEFKAVCDGLEKIKKIDRRAKRLGWQPIKQANNAFIDRRIAEWETSIAANAGGVREIIGPFVKKHAGRDLLLYIQDTKLPNSRAMDGISSCNMFDITEPPPQSELDAVLGEKRVRDEHSQAYIYKRTPDTMVGVSWYGPYGIDGASITTISTRTDKASGEMFVTYDAGIHHWKPPSGKPMELPPPIILKPRVKDEERKGESDASDD
ncbi:hypothetical protein [Erythrobacter sp. THAF29]|uniref:hypothetical protein n=1 Tax=Erythrobacter sp. THAF29 TaxID=2587851 RepID=UPI001267C70B|nr:hypothetical protein [Erythrobacter sp. THAF29]